MGKGLLPILLSTFLLGCSHPKIDLTVIHYIDKDNVRVIEEDKAAYDYLAKHGVKRIEITELYRK